MKGWIFGNLLFIFFIVLFTFTKQEYHSPVLTSGKLFAILAVFLFLININMYFVFLIIRKSKRKDVRKKLALFSRKMMKAHVPIGITATAVILVHALFMISFHPLAILEIKKLSGFVAMGVLAVHLYSGWLRRKKASGFRRKFHLIMAFVFMGVFLVHILF